MPTDGTLPASIAQGASQRTMSAYVHVPFCRVRCGYCDFNTYTATELAGVSQSSYVEELEKEFHLSGLVLDKAGIDLRPLSSVFIGGGTPTLLPATDLSRVLKGLERLHGLQPGAEITTEANPDTLNPAYIEELAQAGFTRVSIGMQSAVPSVLETLDRTHNPHSVAPAVAAVKAAGLDVSVDLIYGTPGETLSQWNESVNAAIELDTGHISAYALIVEEGTALERRIRRGDIQSPDDDLQADMYELADELLEKAGFQWYEVSNWSKTLSQRSVHNLAYWQGQDWWGYGPGAHSHIGGTRFWNVKHPAAYAQQLQLGHSPAAGWEQPDTESLKLEKTLLLSRIREGLPIDGIPQHTLEQLAQDGLIESHLISQGSLVLTLAGRLRADDVVRRIAFE